MPDLAKVLGIEKTNSEFRKTVVEIAERLKVNPNFLMAIMSFESAGTFSPSIKNAAGSGATGLIQFMPNTAKGLGTTTAKLAKMSAVEQLDFVEKHFQPFKGKLNTIEDAYMAVLLPKGVGKGNNFVLFKKGSTSYKQNKGLDLNDDGEITVGEAAQKVAERLKNANGTIAVNAGKIDTKSDSVKVLSRNKKKDDDVEILQDDLISLGYLTKQQKDSGPGFFGKKTERALLEFQKDVLITGVYDLISDAIIKQLKEGVKKGTKSGLVQAMQERLISQNCMTRKQMETGIGTFGSKTQSALQKFQKKNDIKDDGILTLATFRKLFGKPILAPSTNKGINIELPDGGIGFTTYNRDDEGFKDQFGTQATIDLLIEIAEKWHELHPDVTLQFGDISRKDGKAFPPSTHAGHRKGNEVDVRPIRKDRKLLGVRSDESTYDSNMTEKFVNLVRKKHGNLIIFFNDRRLINKGLTAHARNHENHLHLRFL